MEGDLIKINEWLTPLSWLYGAGVFVRNEMFELGLLKSRSFDIPVISIGNITVGGTGKTPHTEYLIDLLHRHFKVAVLSRGYKRKTKGFVLAHADTHMQDIGDEPFQIKEKYPDIYVAVDKDRCHGIEQLCDDSIAKDTEVILLDDAFQHRYVKPGINILLIDYHRMITEDKLLPAGRLREPKEGKSRANIVIVTKCPRDIKPMGFRVISKALNLFPYQKLYFTTFRYGNLQAAHPDRNDRPLSSLDRNEHVLLLTGIASPEQMLIDLKQYTKNITSLSFQDHHYYSESDLQNVYDTFRNMPEKKLIITTEKDYSRLKGMNLHEEIRKNLYVLPIKVEFMQGQENTFNENIIGYVRKNSRNSILAKGKNAK